MKVGTKSLLFGAHQFILHPVFVTAAWIKLYKSLPNPKEFICILIHDWGYWEKPNMDGPEGEQHPLWAAKLARAVFGTQYGSFCLLHSRTLANELERKPSKLCLPDKLGVAMMPPWLWVTLASLTGEIKEYMSRSKYEINRIGPQSPYEFFNAYRIMIAKRVALGGGIDGTDTN